MGLFQILELFFFVVVQMLHLLLPTSLEICFALTYVMVL